MDLSTFKCPVCNDYETQSLDSLRIHGQKKHNISSNSIYIALFTEDKQAPKCACGCGVTPKFWSLQRGYAKFIRGHAARINNNWGHNKVAFEKSLETRRTMWKNGEIQGWCKGLTKDDPRIASIIKKMNTPERSEKISKSLTGKLKSESHKQKISEHMKSYWGREINRERQSLEQSERIKNGLLTKCTRFHGYFSNHKKSTRPNVYYRSLFELNAILHLESNEDVISYAFEPYNIEYSFDGKIRHYIVDCLIEYEDGAKLIVEFKPSCHVIHEKNVAKFQSAERFANENGFKFEVWTEKTHNFLSRKNI